MRLSLLVFFLVLLADQALKIYVKLNLQIGEEIVIFDWFRLHFTENPGMAFGFEFGGVLGKLFLTTFRIVFSIVGFYYLYQYSKKRTTHIGMFLCAGLVLAGAVGNLFDSLFYGLIFTDSLFEVAQVVPWGEGYESFLQGRVVDMLYLPVIDFCCWPEWKIIEWTGYAGARVQFFQPIFNLADFAISVGITFFLIYQNRWFPENK